VSASEVTREPFARTARAQSAPTLVPSERTRALADMFAGESDQAAKVAGCDLGIARSDRVAACDSNGGTRSATEGRAAVGSTVAACDHRPKERPASDREDVGLILREYRLNRTPRMTQLHLAELLNVDQSHVSRIETGQYKIRSIDFLWRIADRLGVEPERLGVSSEPRTVIEPDRGRHGPIGATRARPLADEIADLARLVADLKQQVATLQAGERDRGRGGNHRSRSQPATVNPRQMARARHANAARTGRPAAEGCT